MSTLRGNCALGSSSREVLAMKRLMSILGLAALLALACAGPPAPRSSGQEGVAARPPTTPSTLRYVSRFEASTLAARFTEAAGTSEYVKRPFNAGLGMIDANAQPRPVLAERLPQLNTDTWRVFP